MIARWQMHRYLLRQSMTFFANEFAGRVATKVMQTSLAMREIVMKIIDVFVYVDQLSSSRCWRWWSTADWRLVMPLVALAGHLYRDPRLLRPEAAQDCRSEQADARSMMTGRIVDSYTNIATVKLFSHAGREETYAKKGMDAFLADRASADAADHAAQHLGRHQQLPSCCFAISATQHLVLAEWCDLGWGDCDRHWSGHAHQRHVAMDHVGSLGAV